MITNKCERSSRCRKDLKDGIFLSDDKDTLLIVDNKSKSLNSKIHKTKKITEISAKIMTRNEKGLTVECVEDTKNKSLLKMSVKMNSYIDKNDLDSFSLGDISKSRYKTFCSKYETNGKSNIDTMFNSQICSSCKSNNNKTIKTNDSQIHVSIKNRKSSGFKNNDKHLELNCDINCDEVYPARFSKKHSNSENEKRFLKVDLLLQFLDLMRQSVVTQELSFDVFRKISERLYKDKMNIELLLLSEMIIRTQIIQMTKLISKDLTQNKVTPPVFVLSFLEQYKFLKSISAVYKEMMSDYEATYLTAHKLSFDLINRVYFKRIVQDCPKIKEQISRGHFNVKLDQICSNNLSTNERDRIRIDYGQLKSDIQGQEKLRDIDRTLKKLLSNPNEIVESLLNHSFSTPSHTKNDGSDKSTSSFTVDTYKDILEMISNLPDRISYHSPSTMRCLLKNQSDHLPINKTSQNQSLSDTNVRFNCGAIYQALENIKPPSISCSSSSNNSNGYNSCVSISSYEDSSDEDGVIGNSEKLFQKWKGKCDIEEQFHTFDAEIRRNSDDYIESKSESVFTSHTRLVFNDKDHDNSQDEMLQFDRLYDQYLAENEHLLDRASVVSSSANMSVPDYLNTLEKADNLQSIIKILMARYKKNIDIQEKLSNTPNINLVETAVEYSARLKHEAEVALLQKIDDEDEEEVLDMDFEELSQAFGKGSTTRENLEEFEKFLEGKFDINMGKTHPNLQALVNNCRLNCNKLYKPLSKDELYKRTDSDSSETGRNHFSVDSKQTVSGDESFDLPLDCSPTINIEVDSNHDTCSNNASINNNISSDTGSSSVSTENTGSNNNSNKVCNCCKCEMFGEQNTPSLNRATTVKERLRNKLKRQKQCQQKQSQTNRQSPSLLANDMIPIPDVELLPDLDSLVDFINGSDKSVDVLPQTPDPVRSLPRKSKQKANKSKLKKLTKLINETPVFSDKTEEIKNNSAKEVDILSFDNDLLNNRDNLLSKSTNSSDRIDISEAENESCNLEEEEIEIYDPVVEEFKRFCSNVVVSKERKKLFYDTESLLLEQLHKQQLQKTSPTNIR